MRQPNRFQVKAVSPRALSARCPRRSDDQLPAHRVDGVQHTALRHPTLAGSTQRAGACLLGRTNEMPQSLVWNPVPAKNAKCSA